MSIAKPFWTALSARSTTFLPVATRIDPAAGKPFPGQAPTFPVTVEIRTTRHSYSSIGYVKKPDATPKVLSVSSLSAPAPQETYTQIQEAVDEIIKELRCGIGAANIDPSERETFRELLAKHLDAFAAELRTK